MHLRLFHIVVLVSFSSVSAVAEHGNTLNQNQSQGQRQTPQAAAPTSSGSREAATAINKAGTDIISGINKSAQQARQEALAAITQGNSKFSELSKVTDVEPMKGITSFSSSGGSSGDNSSDLINQIISAKKDLTDISAKNAQAEAAASVAQANAKADQEQALMEQAAALPSRNQEALAAIGPSNRRSSALGDVMAATSEVSTQVPVLNTGAANSTSTTTTNAVVSGTLPKHGLGSALGVARVQDGPLVQRGIAERAYNFPGIRP